MADANYDCSHPVEIEDEPRHHLVIANEFVRALAVEIAPHERTLCHRHPHDYLLYVASGSEIISAARDEEPRTLSYHDGECELSPAGLTHVVENLGDTPFRNVVVELLPRSEGALRGAAPRWNGGEGNGGEEEFSQLLDDERATIFLIQIGPGAEIEISGPAIVATPYSNNLYPACVGDIEVKQNEVCDLAWVPPSRQGVLWGCWDHTERAVVFQIGRTEEQGYAVPVVREPVKSLRAHAEPE